LTACGETQLISKPLGNGSGQPAQDIARCLDPERFARDERHRPAVRAVAMRKPEPSEVECRLEVKKKPQAPAAFDTVGEQVLNPDRLRL
jgi:hypothetical protein